MCYFYICKLLNMATKNKFSKDQIRSMMKYDINDFFKNPHNFDYPPLNYDQQDDLGWNMIARSIITDK